FHVYQIYAVCERQGAEIPGPYARLFLATFFIYTSSFKPPLPWLRSLPRITYLSKLIGIRSLAALMQLE
ncbi:hypothetical protein ACUN9W_21935, partial [Escherichia coli]